MKILIVVLGVCLVPHISAKPSQYKSSIASLSAPAIQPQVSSSRTSGASVQLELVTDLPKELPQRVIDLDFHNDKLWATIYHGKGRYATFDPVTYGWTASHNEEQHQAIRQVSGVFESPGGFCFANGKLWVAGSYGESFGSIDLATWRVERIFKAKQQDHEASQIYTGMTFDGAHLWVAWHWFNYRLHASQTQLLLKIDPQTGKVVQRFPLPRGREQDAIHGLTWDGKQLWHVKDHLLVAIDSSNGQVTARYNLKSLRRPSALAWDGTTLWLAEFTGRIFRLTFADPSLARR